MLQRVLVDTDVILDLLLAREPFFPAAAELFLEIQEGHLTGYASSLSFSNLFYLLRKRMPNPQAIEVLRKLRLLVHALAVDSEVVDRALASPFQDLEDAMQALAAEVGQLDAIVTRNKRDFRGAALPVFSPEELLAALRSQPADGSS